MKHYHLLPFIFLQLAAIAVRSQPTLSSAVIPLPGSTVNYQFCNPPVYVYGSAGANVTWDFTSIDTTTTLIPIQYLSPSQTAYGSSFPAANLSLLASGNYEYYELSDTAYINRGAQGPYALYYSEGEKLLSFPFTYTNNFVSNFNFDVIGTFNRAGSATVTADAYGTLQLPNGTYTNVLRVQLLENYRDSFYTGGIYYDYLDTLYNWYSPQVKGPILTSYHFITTGFSDEDAYVVYYFHDLSTGIKDLAASADFNIYPDPAKDVVFLHLNKTEALPVKITVADLTGKTVREYPSTNELQALDISGIPNGMYLVSLSTAEGFLGARKLNITK